MIDPRRLRDRDKAFRKVRLITAGTFLSAVGVTAFMASTIASAFQHGMEQTAVRPSQRVLVPDLGTPVQKAAPTPAVITKIVHVTGSAGTFIRAPGIAPAASGPSGGTALPPPPPPACVSTPSRPCP